MTGTDDDGPQRAYASPPCMAHEVDPQQARDVARWRRAERHRLRDLRAAMPLAKRQSVAQSIACHLDALLAARFGAVDGLTIAGYWPIKAEPDLRFWLADLHQRGASVVLPVVETERAPLVFRHWEPGMRLQLGHWRIPVPPPEAGSATPDIALAPLVGWDDEGYRLGYGGGYFDRTLAALSPRPFVIGTGLQAARLGTIFPQPHDIALSAIITEAGVQIEAST